MNRRPATLRHCGDVVRTPSWIQDGEERVKVNMLADWLKEGRYDAEKVKNEAVIDEDEVKKDFKETFSYWTQRERGIFENVGEDVNTAADNRRFSLSDSVRQDHKHQQDVASEFLKRSQAILKEERMNLSSQKRYSLPQEQFEKQLKTVQENDRQPQQQQQILPDKKILPPILSVKPLIQPKPKSPSPFNNKPPSKDDLQQQLKQTIEHRRRSYQEHESPATRQFDAKDYKISKRGDIAINDDSVETRKSSARPKSMSESGNFQDGEGFRQQMYNEYMKQVAERIERRKQKVLKISAIPSAESNGDFQSDKPPCAENLERKLSISKLENEFINRAKERMDKLGIRDEEDEDGGYERRMEEDLVSCSEVSEESSQFYESFVEDYVIEGDVRMTELPRHLQEYLALTYCGDDDEDGVWTPGQQTNGLPQNQSSVPSSPNSVAQTVSKFEYQRPKETDATDASTSSKDEAIPVVWTPKSAGASPQLERKEFRPVNFESPTLPRKKYNSAPKPEECFTPDTPPATPPAPPLPSWAHKPAPRDYREDTPFGPLHSSSTSSTSTSTTSRVTSERRVTSSDVAEQRRLTSSKSAPATGLYSLAASGVSLPRVQSPTITLLQKAREGQLPRGALYLDHVPSAREEEQRNHVTGKSDYESDAERQKSEPRPKIEGIGPITKDGMPIVLRSEVKDENHAKWYKRMYDSLHRSGKDDEYVTVRYKPHARGKYPYSSSAGYLSEPEQQHAGYDSDYNRYATLDRRRIKNKENDYTSSLPRSRYAPHPDAIKYATDIYKNQPGRIENYQPGHSSISDKETKQWWDEVLDIFDGAAADQQQQKQQQQQLQQLQQQRYTQNQTAGKSFMSHALKESGYESDSTLVFKRRDDNQRALSPVEHKMAYKSIQKGGEVPLHGFRKLAPERPKESPNRYVESEVTIHYRSPVRAEAKEALGEEELARIQAEAMRRIYQEERRRKYLQELQDMNNRRHTDNFTPSQKSPIPLNRYDDFFDDLPPVRSKSRDRTPEPKLVARALYNFQGQTSRELSFRRGDIIFVRKQIDKNWYEGEHNAMLGLFPFNYVEIIPYDGIRTIPRKPTEGQARAKFNFIAQTHLELSLVKGEVVVLTRRVDDNWYEGRISTRKGIFPVSYVDVLCEPGERPATPLTLSTAKPIASPAAHSLIANGQQQALTQQHHYVPPEATTNYYNQSKRPAYTTGNQAPAKILAPVNQTLHIDTHSDPIPYRALYNYRPQNEDELELKENDTVFVMEKCDDGWYVGSSHRTGYFGTFPGNYVERI